MENHAGRLARPGYDLALRRRGGDGPEVLFLPGLRSDMTGLKAQHVARHCAERGRACTLFDYGGHGASGGRFEDGTIGGWRDDVLAVLDEVVQGPVILVGSSMGGWLALLAALARPKLVRGLIGIAPAPDFTARLLEPRLTHDQRATLARAGRLLLPSAYGEPLPVTGRLLEEGRRHLLLDRPIALACPVHLLHGQADPDVPWQTSVALAGRLEGGPVTLELIQDGDHRLSRESDLRRLSAALDRLVQLAAP